MFEAIAAALGVFFVPGMIQRTSLFGGQVATAPSEYFMMFLLMLVISVLTNMIRTWRTCGKKDDEKDKKKKKGKRPRGKKDDDDDEEEEKGKSYGILNGAMKGGISSAIAILALFLLGYVSYLKDSLYASMANKVDGGIVAAFYLVGHFFVATPLFGTC